MIKIFLILAAIVTLPITALASDSVFVKYRGKISLEPFECFDIKPSSLVRNLCYDERNKYLLVNLNGTYYHYCEIPKAQVYSWMKASSLGKFYNYSVKGNYDCRINYMPKY